MLQRADLAVERAWKRTLFVTEQRAFDRIGRDRTNVEQPEWGFGARAGSLHRAHHHLLAATAFALDQHRALAARRLGRHRQRRAERGRGPDHRIEIGRAGHFFGQRLQFVARRLAGGRHPQRQHHLIGCNRLDQVIGRPGAHRLDREQRRGAGGQHQDRHRRAARAQFSD